MSAYRRCVVIYQTSAFVILLAETSLHYSAIFVGGGARFGFVPRRRAPSLSYWYSHYWFLNGVHCAII